MKKDIAFIAILFIASISAMEQVHTSRKNQSTSGKSMIKDCGLLIWQCLKQNWGEDQVINFYKELRTPRQLDEIEQAQKNRSLSESGIPGLCCTERECEGCIEAVCFVGGIGCTTLACAAGWAECPVVTGGATACCVAAACKAKIRQKYGFPEKKD